MFMWWNNKWQYQFQWAISMKDVSKLHAPHELTSSIDIDIDIAIDIAIDIDISQSLTLLNRRLFNIHLGSGLSGARLVKSRYQLIFFRIGIL